MGAPAINCSVEVAALCRALLRYLLIQRGPEDMSFLPTVCFGKEAFLGISTACPKGVGVRKYMSH